MSEDITTFIGKAKENVANNQFPEAIENLTAVLNISYSHHEARFIRALCYIALEHVEQALKEFTIIIDSIGDEDIDTIPPKLNVYMVRGVTYLRTYEFTKAIDDFETVLQMDPEIEEAKAYLFKAKKLLYSLN